MLNMRSKHDKAKRYQRWRPPLLFVFFHRGFFFQVSFYIHVLISLNMYLSLAGIFGKLAIYVKHFVHVYVHISYLIWTFG